MKKTYLLFLLILLPFLLMAEDGNFSDDTEIVDSFHEYSPLFLYGLGFTEAQLSNVVLWGFNRYITESDYGMITLDSMKVNLTNPWVWDQDEFAVNHMGHPYQGALYYAAGRSSGNGFWASSSITVLGSLTWELLMETETPSINDLIVTTMGGISFGEMLFRLSDVVLYGEENEINEPGFGRWLGAALLSPTTAVNHALLPGRPPETADITGFSSFSMGYSGASVSVLPRPQIVEAKHGFSGTYNFDMDYGTPFIGNKKNKPFDWFSLRTSAGLNFNSELFLSLFTNGHLAGWTFYAEEEDVKNQLGLYLHYDFVFNRIINLGANSIGPGWIRVSNLGENWKIDTRFHLNFVMMGASDLIFLKYNDIVNDPPDYERRSYSLSTGLNFKAGIHLSRKDDLYLDLGYRLYNLYIINGSVPESGSGGKEVVGMVDLRAKKMLNERWFAGVSGALYHKESFYDQFVDLDELLWKTGLFTGIRL